MRLFAARAAGVSLEGLSAPAVLLKRIAVALLFAALLLATRLPYRAEQLYSFDDVNFAYAIGHFDVRLSQPHPPGYPLFVLETRVMNALRVKRAETNLFLLAMLSSLGALWLVVWFGNRLLGGWSGIYAGLLLVVYPTFWYAGLTSALRPHLALVSLAVAATCYRAWCGEREWVLRSAVVLGVGAGIRPELGVVLFPLWLASALRAPVENRERWRALGAMAAAVLVWLLPMMFASGGPVTYVRICLEYLADQASVTSGMFGAADSTWRATFWRLMAWLFVGVPTLLSAAILAWRRHGGFGFGWNRAAFLAVWFVPGLVFSLLVHVEDAGQTLAMVPVVCLVGGAMIGRAIACTAERISRWDGVAFAVYAVGMALVLHEYLMPELFWAIPAVTVVAALLLRIDPVPTAGHPPRLLIAILVLLPVLLSYRPIFLHSGWYFKGKATSGIQATLESAWADFNSGLSFTSYQQMHRTFEIDDACFQALRKLSTERPGETVVMWERGLTSWRKTAYYFSNLPVIVLDHKTLRPGSPLSLTIRRGAQIERQASGAVPLRIDLPRGARLVWLLKPGTDFERLVRASLPTAESGPLLVTDLPREGGTRRVGGYELIW